ncbi:MAG: cysteine synthase A [Chloroflexota bacterium]|nr:cysteine synthase A [Chloroflexota bacterium]
MPKRKFTSSSTKPSVAASVLDLIGNTPLVRLGKISPPNGAQILGKVESFNPAGSVKDRIAKAMIESAENTGLLTKGTTLVEPTSGNTGIGLAMVCSYKGYGLVLTMPEDMSVERQELLKRLGATVIVTPAIEGMTGAVFKAQELVKNEGYIMLQQFDNPSNPETHYLTTGPEIISATESKLDAFVAGVGSGGTITGVARALAEANLDCQIIAVEPASSPVLSGGRPGIHQLQGMGASFVPSVLDTSAYSEVICVSDKQAIQMTARLAKEEGLLVGISAGANVQASIEVAARLTPEQTVVTMLCDTGERYLTVPLT